MREIREELYLEIDVGTRLCTGDAWLVESTHGNMIRPCSARLNEGERLDAGRWCGQNDTGFALMEVRSVLRGPSIGPAPPA